MAPTPKNILIALTALLFIAPAYADEIKKNAVNNFLASMSNEQEGAENAGSTTADLNGDGSPEIVLVWTTMGPTYWHNNLDVISNAGKSLAHFQLIGEAKLSAVKEGVILVDQVLYAKGDPICCPTIKKQMKYRWDGKEISESK